jgi:hypothetical protein
MTARRKPASESDHASRSKRQGGLHSLADAHHGLRSGFDGQVMRAVWGDDPLDFERMVEAEVAERQRAQPDRFVQKIGPRGRRKGRRKA